MASTLKSVLKIFGFVLPVSATIVDIFGYIAKVEGLSMQPTLNPERETGCDFVLLNKFTVRNNYEFDRGEIVSIISPTQKNQKIIKRVIGLPGDIVTTRAYKNRYLRIPEGHLWVEGDNHSHSLDSNTFGPVAMGLIHSKASRIVWPPTRCQKLNPSYPRSRINNPAVLDFTDFIAER